SRGERITMGQWIKVEGPDAGVGPGPADQRFERDGGRPGEPERRDQTPAGGGDRGTMAHEADGDEPEAHGAEDLRLTAVAEYGSRLVRRGRAVALREALDGLVDQHQRTDPHSSAHRIVPADRVRRYRLNRRVRPRVALRSSVSGPPKQQGQQQVETRRRSHARQDTRAG